MASAACDDGRAHLIADGTTPNERLVLVDCLATDDGYAFELDQPFFLAVGDRIAFENGDPVVMRSGGDWFTPRGSWATRCRPAR